MVKKSPLFVFVITAALTATSCTCQEEKTAEPVELAALNPQPVDYQAREKTNSDVSNSRETAITRAVAEVSDAVCGINVTQIREYRRPYFEDPFFRFFFPERIPRRAVKSLGSGFVISPDGYIVTNQHVVENAIEIVVVLPDGSTHQAEIIGEDRISDIALLKIDGDNHKYVKLGNSDDVIIGEWVIALGNPFGLFEINAKPTVTVGVVSAVDRDFGKQENDRVYQDMIQTDAAINQGNSGGPLVNSLGEVIGMNTFIFTGGNSSGNIGLGFAIPINRIKRILRDLMKYGKVDRSWTTGIVVENIAPLVADYLGLPSTEGVIVTDVEADSPARQAGLQVGDVIVAVNGKHIRNQNDIWTVIENLDLKPGDEIRLDVLRGRKELVIRFRLKGLAKR